MSRQGCATTIKLSASGTLYLAAMLPPTMRDNAPYAPTLVDQKRPHTQHTFLCDHIRTNRHRRLLLVLPALLLLLALAALLALICTSESGLSVLRDAGMDNLVRRSLSSGSFVHRKRTLLRIILSTIAHFSHSISHRRHCWPIRRRHPGRHAQCMVLQRYVLCRYDSTTRCRRICEIQDRSKIPCVVRAMSAHAAVAWVSVGPSLELILLIKHFVCSS
jgi:hypothetical protein